jgi:hypothetical protein
MVSEVVDHFGGMQEFAQAWLEQVNRMRTQAPTGKKILDFYRAVIRMAELSEEREPPPQQLDDEALGDELLRRLQQLILENPAIVLQVAQALGWTVIPPVKQP